MAHNYLEQLVAEWYEYRSYFVRRNVPVGKRPAGGYECELDVVAFKPDTKHLVHIEPSMDADKWSVRESRFAKKFEAGRKHIPSLFQGLDVPAEIEQVALFVFASTKNFSSVGGGRVMLMPEFLSEILGTLRMTSVYSSAVPEQISLLRTLQFVSEYRKRLSGELST